MLRFVPDDDSRQTIAVFAAAHPVALGEKNTKVSSDFPYYMVDELNKNNYNGIFFQGPQLAVTTSGDFIDEELKSSEQEGYMKFGRGLARYAMSLVGTDKEKAVKPILNVRIAETFIPAENEVFMLIGKVGLVTNIILKSGRKPSDLVFVTEVGYVQLGENKLCPCSRICSGASSRGCIRRFGILPQTGLGAAADENDGKARSKAYCNRSLQRLHRLYTSRKRLRKHNRPKAL